MKSKITPASWSLELSNQVEERVTIPEKKVKKRKELSKLVSTFFRNGLKSNLDLTSLADTKAGILISINGFILTVSVTASGFAIHNAMMSYAFIAIILTSLGSIILAVMAVKPRNKKSLVKKEFLEGYESLLYYQDMADMAPEDYNKKVSKAIYRTKATKDEMISHLHILAAEIKKKYFWLKQAYTFFSIGLVISAILVIYALIYVEKTAFYNLSKGNVAYKKDKFYNVFEPSGATTMPDGKVLIVEDESAAKSLKLLEIENDGTVSEIGNLYLPKKVKKIFKKGVEDLEAIAADGERVYAITSFTFNKKNRRKAAREKFMMFTYKDGAVEDFYIYKRLKADLYQKFPKIFKNDIFSTNVMNIEGLTINPKSGGVLIAFRAPLINGDAFMIEIKNPKAVLLGEERPDFSALIRLDLNGLGIRDITYDAQKDGYWLIAGGSQSREFRFELWFLDRETQKLTYVENQPDIGYGEGITLVHPDSKNPALFIVEDNGKKPNKSAEYVIINRDSL